MQQQIFDGALLLFVAGFFAGFVICWVMQPVRPTRVVAIVDDVGMSIQREFAKMAW